MLLPIMESQPHWKRRLFNQYKTPSIQKTHQSCQTSKLLLTKITTLATLVTTFNAEVM